MIVIGICSTLSQMVFVEESGGNVHAFIQILVMISILVLCYFILN